MAVQPSATPPAVTTGVRPSGWQTLYLQPPTPSEQEVNDLDACITTPTVMLVTQISSIIAPVLLVTQMLLITTPAVTIAETPSVQSFGTPLSVNPSPTQPRHGPWTLTLSQAAKANIKKLPQKCSLEDHIIDIQEKNIAASEHWEAKEQALKKHRLLMEEFKCGIWTAQQYYD
ncbi:hypothetical protein CPB84DRAFT_1849501 [Gymnopilus junonius]|uniref:Uncharacterized protein n=1 Tax=Gymnopilus junonius TaxID=109634 RepID=A0A9P5NIR7_GYMJU|nr:hypothetical protein CPB84DRAFT_1849501 [Gymnopilus junonius]